MEGTPGPGWLTCAGSQSLTDTAGPGQLLEAATKQQGVLDFLKQAALVACQTMQAGRFNKYTLKHLGWQAPAPYDPEQDHLLQHQVQGLCSLAASAN